jgi:hypothetical protein
MAFEAMIATVWTGIPGIIQAVTNSGNTVEVQPAINGRILQLDGTYKFIQPPKLVDVPICWQGGGGATWTFPIAKGDECLVVFSSRNIDNWWQNGFSDPSGQIGADGRPINLQNNPLDWQMHDISDGFAIVGLRSYKRRFTTFDATTARLRTDDDSCYVEFDPINKKVKIVASGGVTINNVTFDSSGNVVSPQTITGQTQVVAGTGGNAIHLTTHTHTDPQGGVVSAPTPGS